MEAIYALGSPTVHEFADFMRISSSNAAYKIGSLIRKGYVEKVQSESDGREYHLRPTQKYLDYYDITSSYVHKVMERIKQRFSPEDLAKMDEILTVMGEELMPEVSLPASGDAAERKPSRQMPSCWRAGRFRLALFSVGMSSPGTGVPGDTLSPFGTGLGPNGTGNASRGGGPSQEETKCPLAPPSPERTVLKEQKKKEEQKKKTSAPFGRSWEKGDRHLSPTGGKIGTVPIFPV